MCLCLHVCDVYCQWIPIVTWLHYHFYFSQWNNFSQNSLHWTVPSERQLVERFVWVSETDEDNTCLLFGRKTRGPKNHGILHKSSMMHWLAWLDGGSPHVHSISPSHKVFFFSILLNSGRGSMIRSTSNCVRFLWGSLALSVLVITRQMCVSVRLCGFWKAIPCTWPLLLQRQSHCDTYYICWIPIYKHSMRVCYHPHAVFIKNVT